MNNPGGEFVEVSGSGKVFDGAKQHRGDQNRRTYEYLKNHSKKKVHERKPMLTTINSSENPPKVTYLDGFGNSYVDQEEKNIVDLRKRKTKFIH